MVFSAAPELHVDQLSGEALGLDQLLVSLRRPARRRQPGNVRGRPVPGRTVAVAIHAHVTVTPTGCQSSVTPCSPQRRSAAAQTAPNSARGTPRLPTGSSADTQAVRKIVHGGDPVGRPALAGGNRDA